jgi:hypothetical protein
MVKRNVISKEDYHLFQNFVWASFGSNKNKTYHVGLIVEGDSFAISDIFASISISFV